MKKLLTSAALVAISIGIMPPPAGAQNEHFVWLGGGHVSPYSSWATAATNINDAITSAAPGAVIWVTNGVYDNGGRPYAPAGGSNRVFINKPVTVRSVNGPALTSIRGATPNGPAAVRCVYMTNGSALIGFTLTNGATLSTGDSRYDNGGGAYCESTTEVVVSNCVFGGNFAARIGGGAYRGTLYNCELNANTCGRNGAGACNSILRECSLNYNYGLWGGGAYGGELYDCTLISNRAGYDGTGADACVLSNCFVSGGYSQTGGGANNCRTYDCVISNNYASGAYGGGGSYSGAHYSCRFYNNTAGNGGGARYGLYYDCEFRGNTTTSGDGAGAQYGEYYSCLFIANKGGASAAANGDFHSCEFIGNTGNYGAVRSSVLYDCLLTNNYATRGGGAYASTLYGCRLFGNTAQYNGGGVLNSTAYNCLIFGNTAGYAGGGGGAGDSTLYNCTVVGNSAPSTVSLGGGVSGGNNHNCIVLYNFDDNAGCSNYWGLTTNFTYSCTAPLPPGEGNIDVNPRFLDAAGENFRLTRVSPCFNSGANYPWMNDTLDVRSKDVEGGPRIRHNTVDMGAYELRVPRGGTFSAE